MYKQEHLKIGDVIIPIIIEDGIRWFSLVRLCKNILLRSGICSKRDLDTKYKHHVRFFDIKYSKNQPVKSTICISESGLIEILVKTKIEKMTIKQIEHQNVLHTYLGIIPIVINEKDIEKMKKQKAPPEKWDKKRIRDQIKKRYKKKMSLSSASVQGESRSLHEAAINHYGSWENAITEILKIDYDLVREDIDLMQYYGHKFETLLGMIIEEVDGEFTKGYTKYLKPDFVLDKQWIDAKLSQWTNSIPETIEKYEPFCDSLRIIYLRGDKKFDKLVADKTRMISVYMYIKTLSIDRQQYYIKLLDDMYEKANTQEEQLKLKKIV